MVELFIEFARLILGLILLVKGADLMVGSASRIAKAFGISELVIGLTIVALGTSLPELGVSLYASLTGEADISVGNIVGSNILNITFILGTAALWSAYNVHRKVNVLRDSAFLLVSALIFFISASTGTIGPTAGMIMLVGYIFYTYILFSEKEKKSMKPRSANGFLEHGGVLLLSIVAIIAGSNWTVESAVSIAEFFGASKWLISATIIALGTSFPELAVSITAFLRGKYDISLGNIMGSNILNIFLVGGLAALFNPLQVNFQAVGEHFGLMLISTVMLIFFLIDRRLSRAEGIILIFLFALYMATFTGMMPA